MKYNNHDVYLGAIYDTMRLLGHKAETFLIDIKPICGYKEIINGPAFTTKGRLTSEEDDYQKLDNIRIEMYQKKFFQDNPIVLLEANDSYCAHSGDITSLIYKSLGAKGFVTDGIVRDIDIIDKLQFPIFCHDSNPIDAINYWALTEYQTPITLKNVIINPGDHIFASRDGVIRVPQTDIPKFNQTLVEILEKEAKARALIENIKDKESYQNDLLTFIDNYDRW